MYGDNGLGSGNFGGERRSEQLWKIKRYVVIITSHLVVQIYYSEELKIIVRLMWARQIQALILWETSRESCIGRPRNIPVFGQKSTCNLSWENSRENDIWRVRNILGFDQTYTCNILRETSRESCIGRLRNIQRFDQTNTCNFLWVTSRESCIRRLRNISGFNITVHLKGTCYRWLKWMLVLSLMNLKKSCLQVSDSDEHARPLALCS
jgi:hypothetical protein